MLEQLIAILFWSTFCPLSTSGQHQERRCGQRLVDRYGSIKKTSIIGNSTAKIEEFPWMASITKDGKNHCSATLISPRFLLTAAHCFDFIDVDSLTVVLGSDDLERHGYHQIERFIESYQVHPGYEICCHYFDVALVELDPEVPYDKDNPAITPICLPTEASTKPNNLAGISVTLTGYGQTNVNSDNQKLSFTTLQIHSKRWCDYQYRDYRSLPRKFESNVICAGYILSGQGACNGDSGGPLLTFHDDPADRYFTQVAVVSGGKNDGCSGYSPGVYTNLEDPEVFQWIQRVAFGIDSIDRELIAHKVLITTGVSQKFGISDEIGQGTIIIDLKDDKIDCTLPDYPSTRMHYGTGGIVEAEIPMVCGGYDGDATFFKDCHKFVDNTWVAAGKIETGRSSMGSGNIVINGNLLLSGGFVGTKDLDSSVLIDSSSTMELKDLPIEISTHCNVRMNSSHMMVTGGYSYDGGRRSETLLFDLTKEEWADGPSMRAERSSHGCAQMALGDKTIIWVTGGWDGSRSIQFTEYLEDLNQGWQSGPDLPYPLSSHRMVALEDFKSIYITGGDGRQNNGEILQLQCSGSTPDTCAFKPSALNVKVDRQAHIALPISNALADKLCN